MIFTGIGAMLTGVAIGFLHTGPAGGIVDEEVYDTMSVMVLGGLTIAVIGGIVGVASQNVDGSAYHLPAEYDGATTRSAADDTAALRAYLHSELLPTRYQGLPHTARVASWRIVPQVATSEAAETLIAEGVYYGQVVARDGQRGSAVGMEHDGDAVRIMRPDEQFYLFPVQQR